MSTREDDLVCAVLEVLDRKAEWQASGETRLSEPFLTAVDKMFETFAAGDTPRDCYALRQIVERAQAEWRDFEFYVSAVDPTPRQPFWRAIGELDNALAFVPPQIEDFVVESLQELHAAGVSDRQAALIYSHDGIGPFMTPGPNPQPLPNKVKQERQQPGSVLPTDWVHPKIVADRAKAAQYSNRLAMRAQQLRDIGAVSGPAIAAGVSDTAYPVGPETIEELLEQKVPDSQILLIKRCTLDDIAQVKAKLAAEAAATVDSQVAAILAKSPDAKNADIAAEIGCEVKLVAAARRKLKDTAALAG